MKTATKFTLILSLWVIALFGSAMMLTFFSEFLSTSGFFGDQGNDWGVRHYWYAWMSGILFFISLVRIIMWIYEFWDNILK